ncbi:hypothetical protein WA158_005398 [Blastocystis sp. Blastoise]
MTDNNDKREAGPSKLDSLLDNINISDSAVNNMSSMFNSSDDGQYDFLEPDKVKRTWSEMCFHNVAVCYLSGLTFGGIYGLYEGLKTNKSKYFKIRVNTVLNKMTLRGPSIGNAAGILALLYGSSIWAIDKGCDQVGVHKNDIVGPLAAGFTTGAFFKCTAGFKSSILSGIIGIGAVLALKGIQEVQKKMGVKGHWRTLLYL